MKTANGLWQRLLWAVEMRSKSCKPRGMVIGVAWDHIAVCFLKLTEPEN